MSADEDIELLKRRFTELSARSDAGFFYSFTDFLGLAEQSAFKECQSRLRGQKYTVFGGLEGTERVMIRFGDPEAIGYEQPFPIRILRAEPRSQKYADKLTHRDFLGALMNLGIERDVLGDIAVVDNVGYLIVKEEIADYIRESLTRVKHTDLNVLPCEDPPKDRLFRTEERTVQISSERLDALVARIYKLSREDAQALFKKKLVYVGGRLCESTSHTPKVGDIISVRGYGRFAYRGYESLSKKGKLNCLCLVYV
jgi:RNA-binding protein YlmH